MGSFFVYMAASDKQKYWYLFADNQLILEDKAGKYVIPSGETSPYLSDHFLEVHRDDHTIHYVTEIGSDTEITDHYKSITLRDSWDYLDKESFRLAGKAAEILYWDHHSRFCPVCGASTIHALPGMKLCPQCKYELYPSIPAAILALVRKEDSILLVRGHNFRANHYGLVAGFLETGESLEECVAREVKEETGLDIENITYFGNQFWPFPSGLMVGFIADYVGGEIKLQEEELQSAGFYNRSNLPALPGKVSLARKMIDWWIENPS